MKQTNTAVTNIFYLNNIKQVWAPVTVNNLSQHKRYFFITAQEEVNL